MTRVIAFTSTLLEDKSWLVKVPLPCRVGDDGPGTMAGEMPVEFG